MDRQFAIGLAATGAGLASFLLLGALGSLRHPQAAAEYTQPAEFLAIGGGFALLTIGVLVTFFAYIELPEPEA
jgi:hypothetical protein